MLTTRPVRGQQGFHFFIVLVVILVLGGVGFAGFWVYKKTNNSGTPSSGQNYGPHYKALTSCSDSPLNTLPTDLSELDSIAPLGNVDPPDHTLPTDHMYMMYPYGVTGQHKIYAPANIVVTNVSYGSEHSSERTSADYALSVYPCEGLKLIFGHVDVLNEKITAAIGSDFDNNRGCSTSQQAGRKLKRCEKQTDVTIPAGELLGTADGWDLWATKEGVISPDVISPEYYHNVDAVCPLDYFTNNLKSQLYAIVKRSSASKCGQAYQDKADSLQGGWFAHKDPAQAKTDWSSHFSLVHHSIETNASGLLAMAKEDFIFRFTPRTNGTINREPSQTAMGTLYCYQHEGDQRLSNGVIAGTGKVLLKLADNHTMQFEHKPGTCTANETFTQPTVYYR